MKSKSARASLERWMKPARRRRRKGGEPDAKSVSLGAILARLDPEVGPSHPDAGPITQSDWEKLVGPRIADRSSPERLEPDGTLVVRVPTSVWAQELSLLSATILERVAQLGLRASRLRTIVGAAPQQLRPTAQRHVRRLVAAPVPLPPSVRESVAEIEDQALRESVAAAATASLSEVAADERRARDKGRSARARTPQRRR